MKNPLLTTEDALAFLKLVAEEKGDDNWDVPAAINPAITRQYVWNIYHGALTSERGGKSIQGTICRNVWKEFKRYHPANNRGDTVKFTASIPADLRDEITAEARRVGISNGEMLRRLWLYYDVGYSNMVQRLADAAGEVDDVE